MKCLVAVSVLIGIAYGGSLHGTTPSLASGYESDHGNEHYGGDYGEKCYPTYETKYKEQCEDYHEKVCYTTHNEQCKDVMGKKCKAIQSSKHERKCYDVSELLCSLKESVQYEEIPAVFTVQKCGTVTERVCDTVYDTELTERDDFQCINIVNPYCAMKEHTVYDKTCRTLVNFDCKAVGYGSKGYESSGSADGYGSSSGSDGYGSSSGLDGYGTSGSYKDTSYAPEHKCTKTHETKCYTTPRTVSTEYCEPRDQKVCEKLTERVPVPSERQNCHDEKKKVCELEQRSQPKQVKKYVYTKQCTPVSKTVCDNADQKYLEPVCVPYSRKECSYHPQEQCENVPKQHCYKIPYQVKKMVCTKEYGSDQSYANDGGDAYDKSSEY